MIDLGTGNNNKMCVSSFRKLSSLSSFLIAYSNWAMDNKQEVNLFIPWQKNLDETIPLP